MNGVFTMDGIDYNVDVMKLQRKASITDTENSGRTLDHVMHRDIVGTFYNYTMEIRVLDNDYMSYDNFYEAVTDPNVDSHLMVFPYGQSTLEFQAYVTSATDELHIQNGHNLWAHNSGLSLNFIAMAPQRRR